jgi:branched-chain amino acid transport system permease protein
MSNIVIRRAGLSASRPAVPGLVLVAGLAVLAAVPGVASEYWLSAVLTPFLILSLAGLGLNLLTGYAGQLSLGTAAFMAVGAYAT